MYALATAIVTPKLIIHVFIGARLAAIAKSGEKMGRGTKAINWISIAVGMMLGLVTGWYIYRRTTARARELELTEEVPTTAGEGRGRRRQKQQQQQQQQQQQRPKLPSGLRRFSDESPDEHETAMLLEDDQIDFLDQQEEEEEEHGRGHGYRDEFAEDGDGDDDDDDAGILKLGMRDEEDAIGLDDHVPARRS